MSLAGLVDRAQRDFGGGVPALLATTVAGLSEQDFARLATVVFAEAKKRAAGRAIAEAATKDPDVSVRYRELRERGLSLVQIATELGLEPGR